MLRTQNSAIARVRSRLSYANVGVSLALLLALGGTATAAITLPNNSVGSAQIQTDAVGAPEVQADAIRAAEIRANAVGSDEIDAAAIGSSEIAANAVGGPEIAANAVSGDEIAANAVGGPEIEANAVGGPEIETDAVGSPEIETDAVGSPEIEAGAVRSSEILDDTIRLADIAPDARAALDAPSVRIDNEYYDEVPVCAGPLADCPNLASINLPAGRWLVQSAFTISGTFGYNTFCGLVEADTTTIDHRTNVGLGTVAPGAEQVPLLGVLTTTGDFTTVAVRCQYGGAQDLFVSSIVLTGVEVKAE